jgi:hypothetical protein
LIGETLPTINLNAPAEPFRWITASDATQHNGGNDMGEKGKKDKGGKEKKKEPQMTLKEKRQAKKEAAKNKDYSA